MSQTGNKEKLLVKRIVAHDFRNYQRASVDLSPFWTVLSGPNGAGKTNFLELIAFDLRGVSFKSKIKDLLRWETSKAEIKIKLSSGNSVSTNIVETENGSAHRRMLNGIETRVFDNLTPPLALFLPQEEYLLDTPGGRRRILSRGLMLQSHLYRTLFLQYQKILKQRNALLRFLYGKGGESVELQSWTEQIIEPMLQIWKVRMSFLEVLNKKLPKIIKELGGINYPLRAELSFGGFSGSGKNIDAEKILARFEDLNSREREAQTTLLGPHRDLFRFTIEGRDALPLLSRGQRRLVLLSLHIIEGEHAAEQSNIEPLYLLDDVFSELDPPHREAIALALKGSQTVVTTADDKILPNLPGDSVYYNVENGNISKSEKRKTKNSK